MRRSPVLSHPLQLVFPASLTIPGKPSSPNKKKISPENLPMFMNLLKKVIVVQDHIILWRHDTQHK